MTVLHRRTIYLVKDLARETGESVYTVEHYLRRGLLKEFGRGPHTNYRYFNQKTVNRLKEIQRLRVEGKSLKEIKGLLG